MLLKELRLAAAEENLLREFREQICVDEGKDPGTYDQYTFTPPAENAHAKKESPAGELYLPRSSGISLSHLFILSSFLLLLVLTSLCVTFTLVLSFFPLLFFFILFGLLPRLLFPASADMPQNTIRWRRFCFWYATGRTTDVIKRNAKGKAAKQVDRVSSLFLLLLSFLQLLLLAYHPYHSPLWQENIIEDQKLKAKRLEDRTQWLTAAYKKFETARLWMNLLFTFPYLHADEILKEAKHFPNADRFKTGKVSKLLLLSISSHPLLLRYLLAYRRSRCLLLQHSRTNSLRLSFSSKTSCCQIFGRPSSAGRA